MSINRLCIALLRLSIGVVPMAVSAQELMPTRPKTVVEIRVSPGQDVRSIMERIVSASERAGCNISGTIEWSEGYFECNREESVRIHHRAAVWLEWKLADPSQTLRVLIAYTKVQDFVGSGWAKVSTNPKDEDHNTRALRRAIAQVAGL